MGALADVTVCIKHTPGFASRRRKLATLLGSLRQYYGSHLHIIVATESHAPQASQPLSVEYQSMESDGLVDRFLILPAGSGLSAGRNALVRAARTAYIALMDDDLVLQSNRSLTLLRDALNHDPDVALAGGCHFDLRRRGTDCFNMQFAPSSDGSIVDFHRARGVSPLGCTHVHATHNFFVAHTAVLRRLGWDARQRVMEHETFFYQLYLNGARVLACPEAIAAHDTRTASDDDYELRSLRATEGLRGRDPGNRFMQYLCKNLPEVRRFHTPFTSWHCDAREFCTPLWDAEFAFDGRHCAPFQWDEHDDASTVVRGLTAPYHHASTGVSGLGSASMSAKRAMRRSPHDTVPLLVLIVSESAQVERRAWQRTTWLSFRWHARTQRDEHGASVRGDGDRLVPWRHAYVMPGPQRDAGPHNTSVPVASGQLVGDTIAFDVPSRQAVVLPALRWALAEADFQCVLLTSDRSVVHVGRVWEWLLTRTLGANSRLLAWRSASGSASGEVSHNEVPDVSHTVAKGGSLLVGRAAARSVATDAGRKARNRLSSTALGLDGMSPPGFSRVAAGERFVDEAAGPRLLRGQLVVDNVRYRPYDVFRWLLRAPAALELKFPAVWTNPRAFARSDCSECERAYFPVPDTVAARSLPTAVGRQRV